MFPACIADDLHIRTNHNVHQPAQLGGIFFFIHSLDRSNRKQRKAHEVFLLQQRKKTLSPHYHRSIHSEGASFGRQPLRDISRWSHSCQRQQQYLTEWDFDRHQRCIAGRSAVGFSRSGWKDVVAVDSIRRAAYGEAIVWETKNGVCCWLVEEEKRGSPAFPKKAFSL